METFTTLKSFEINSDFESQRRHALQNLKSVKLDPPIIPVIEKLAGLPCCFTLQSCYGHFLYSGQQDVHNCSPLPQSLTVKEMDFRIAYLALCIQNNEKGKALFHLLKKFEEIDRQFIQFGCAEWFWKQQVNSFAIQVTPDRFKYKDRCIINPEEAYRIEKTKTLLWKKMTKELEKMS